MYLSDEIEQEGIGSVGKVLSKIISVRVEPTYILMYVTNNYFERPRKCREFCFISTDVTYFITLDM